ncbi:MAG: EamA family transporter [Syntrophobacterales bacterium]|nr:EamA family transporter [Syntrophobacterales bacterium]
MSSYVVIILILLCVMINVTGQILLRYGASKLGHLAFSCRALPALFRQVALNPFILGSLTCAGVGLLLWLVILSRAEVSFAYPMVSISYVFTAVAAWRLLGENLRPIRLLGIFLICAGVFLIARS